MNTLKNNPLSCINQQLQQKLVKLGIRNELDLILHLPLRYEDETRLYTIQDIPEGKAVQIEGVVVHCEIITRPRQQLLCQIKDSSGILSLRFLNFYPNQVKAYTAGTRVRAFGEVRTGFFGLEMIHPKCRVVHDEVPLADTLTPVYPTTAGVTQKTIVKLIQQALRNGHDTECLAETLPVSILERYQLLGFRESVRLLHQPFPDIAMRLLQSRTHPAWRRIKFDELLAQQLSLRMHYRQRRSYQAPAFPGKNYLTQTLLASLSFSLTDAQKRVLTEIKRDLSTTNPMQRLLQGDVGSGKTIVATLAALQVIENGYQVAIMAPTEILAEQHYQKFLTWLTPLGVTVAWLSSSQKKKQRDHELTEIATGNAMLAVGTHALFQEQVQFLRLGLVIVDEQHRFGVHQRLALWLKGSRSNWAPHQLMMSATPIPRTLSMSYYADLDISVIDQLPPGRSPTITKLIDEGRRNEVIVRVRKACQGGKQAYWVCPLIEESEVLQLKTAVETYEVLSQTFPDLKISLVHGRLNAQEKSTIMAAFSQGEIQLLVATSVIEVGVDVPNASLMIIEHAERMGLSQLHQLRGRIGRGNEVGICVLLYQKPLSQIARERLRIIFEYTDGFEIARQDLKLRGPGEFLGTRQSGIPMLRFADLQQDMDLLKAARAAADCMLRDYPEATQRHLQRWLGEINEYLRA